MGEARRRKLAGTYPKRTSADQEPFGDVAFFVIEIGSRDDLTEQRAAWAVDQLSGAMRLRRKPTIEFTIGGYDEDPRELRDIPEVCNYILSFYEGLDPRWIDHVSDGSVGLISDCVTNARPRANPPLTPASMQQ